MTQLSDVQMYHFGARQAIRTLAEMPRDSLPELCTALREEIMLTDRAVPSPEEHGVLYVLRFALGRASAALATELATQAQVEQCEAKIAALTAHLGALRASLPRARESLSLLDRRGVMQSAEFKARQR